MVEMNTCVQGDWSGCKHVSGGICVKRVKAKVYETVVKPAVLFGLGMVGLTKRQEAGLELAEIKILRF